MIPFFDSFVDTREKRYHLLLIMLFINLVILIVPYMIVGVKLILLHDYASAFDLLKSPYVEWTYLSRIIVDAMSLTKFQFTSIISLLIQNLRVPEITCCILLVLSYGILERKRATTICLILALIEISGISFLAVHALGQQTLQAVIHDVILLGYLMLLLNLVLTAISIYYMYHQLRYYKEALAYTSIEYKEKEHMEN